jgi:hypothetical protein
LTIGATIPAAVIMATVADPCAMRIAVAMRNTTTSGEIDEVTSILPATAPTPESTITCLNAPPPPMMQSRAPIGARDSAAIRIAFSWLTPRRRAKNHNASRVVMVRAVNGWPRNTAAGRNGIFDRLATVAPKIRTTGSRSRSITSHTGGGACVSPAATAVEAISGSGT